MTKSADIVYQNSGRDRAEKVGEQLGEKPDAQKLMTETYHYKGNATEELAMWKGVLKHGAYDTADQHLPKGFTLTGADGHEIVKDAKGKTVFDEAKLAQQAKKDAEVHDGEGPYQALRRQGMTDAEAKKAAGDVKATGGPKGHHSFKHGDGMEQEKDGRGSWHKDDASRLDAQRQKTIDAEKRHMDAEQSRDEHAFGTIRPGFSEVTKADLDRRLDYLKHGGKESYEGQGRELEAMKEHFYELSGGTTNLSADSIKRWYDSRRSATQFE